MPRLKLTSGQAENRSYQNNLQLCLPLHLSVSLSLPPLVMRGGQEREGTCPSAAFCSERGDVHGHRRHHQRRCLLSCRLQEAVAGARDSADLRSVESSMPEEVSVSGYVLACMKLRFRLSERGDHQRMAGHHWHLVWSVCICLHASEGQQRGRTFRALPCTCRHRRTTSRVCTSSMVVVQSWMPCRVLAPLLWLSAVFSQHAQKLLLS